MSLPKNVVLEWLNAAKKGDVQILKSIYSKEPAIVNTRGEGTPLEGIGSSALHWSIAKGYIQAVDFLLDIGVDPNLRNGSGSTPLHTACTYGYTNVVKDLLMRGCDPLLMNENNEDPQTVAEKRGHASAAELVGLAKTIHDLRGKELDSWKARDMKALAKLVGADLRGVLEVDDMRRKCEEILIANPDLSWIHSRSDGNSRSAEGLARQTENVVASQNSVSEVASGVRSSNTSIRSVEISAGDTSKTEGATPSSDSGAEHSIPNSRRVEKRPLSKVEALTIPKQHLRTYFGAVKSKDLASVSSMISAEPLLITHNGEGSSYGFTGNTALHWAAAKNWKEGVEYLLGMGARVNEKNKGGSTPLHSAAAHDAVEVIPLLFRAGAEPQLTDVCGETPLESATKRENRAATRVIQLWTAAKILFSTPPISWKVPSMKALLSANRVVLGSVDKDSLIEETRKVREQEGYYFSEVDEEAGSSNQEGLSRGYSPQSSAAEKSNEAADAHTKGRALKAKEKGNEFFRLKDYEKAAKMFSMALRLDPQNVVLLSNRSAAYAGLGMNYEALDDAKRAIAMDPKFVKAYGRLGLALARLGQLEEAVAAYHEGLELDPENPGLLQGLQALGL